MRCYWNEPCRYNIVFMLLLISLSSLVSTRTLGLQQLVPNKIRRGGPSSFLLSGSHRRFFATTTSSRLFSKSTDTNGGSCSSDEPEIEISPTNHGTQPLRDFSQYDSRLFQTLKQQRWTKPTPIQAHAIPLLQNGYDVMASSQTGSGKSLMFCLPMIETILNKKQRRSNNNNNNNKASRNNNNNNSAPQALIVSPTRELAIQTSQLLKILCRHVVPNLQVSLATGGSNLKQQRQQLANCNILVGTPGRILQFADERQLSLRQLDFLVIDEADRLLDLGFEPQLTRIARLLKNTPHQSILCSATFPSGVQRIAADFLQPNYYFVSIGRVGSTHSRIQQLFEWADTPQQKEKALLNHVQTFIKSNNYYSKKNRDKQSSIIVFVNTKDDAERYGKALKKSGHKYRVIHGDKSQTERNQALREFSNGSVPILVATDIAARGLDITSIGLVLQIDTPRALDTFTHRVGRTARAGASGRAVTLANGRAVGIASGLVELLYEAKQSPPPSWLLGMAHVAQTRQWDETQELAAAAAGGGAVIDDPTMGANNIDSGHNEQFTGQDFRRTASEGSYGAGRDVAYRSFDDEAYSNGTVAGETVSDEEAESDALDKPTLASEDAKPMQELPSTLLSETNRPFERQRASKQLRDRVKTITGMNSIGESPDGRVVKRIPNRGPDQRLHFEYLGMFDFDKVYPLLSKVSNEDRKGSGDGLPRVLMVAEKPSIAEAIADALSGPRGARKRRGISPALPVYEFTTNSFEPINDAVGSPTRCIATVTSVVGHVFSLGFDSANQSKSNPGDFFHLPVVKQEEPTTSKLRVVDHLRALAGKSDHLVLWLDDDNEGESIAHEVMAVTRRSLKQPQEDNAVQVHRARFSAITSEALKDAFSTLQEPNAAVSRSVDARQELDLRIGVAMTRLLSWRCVGLARKRFAPSTKVISYGPCQTPTLSFCVNRGREIEDFEPQKFTKVTIEAKIPCSGKTVELQWRIPEEDQVVDTRKKGRQGKEVIQDNATFNKHDAEELVHMATKSSACAIVTDVVEISNSIPPPLGLNTVALLEAGSKAMGMSPKQVMNVAEKLYSAGLISYPRTETTKYNPNGFDVRSVLREHTSSENWGRSASYLLRAKYSKSGRPPLRGKDVGDHPPITPLKAATRQEVGGGAAWRVYEFVVRNFLGSLHNELSFTRRMAALRLDDETSHVFDLELISIESMGFADCCRWVLNDINAPKRKDDEISLDLGQRLPLSKALAEAAQTRPPAFLQEHELIRLMDEERIGTDASVAVHVSNVMDRGYVVLCDEVGDPIRPPRPPRPGQTRPPRQIGRYLVPTALGMSLLDLFDQDDVGQIKQESPALLSKPAIRRQMEEEVKQIALGELDKETCLENNLAWFEARYREVEDSLSRQRLNDFGQSLCPTHQTLKYWRKLEAFERKQASTSNKHGGAKDRRSRAPQPKGNQATNNPRRPLAKKSRRGQSNKRSRSSAGVAG